tara:strand:- start:722 stop:1192 length:471 start_codon:yes stop_codon:yes gene_type:complete
MLRAIKKSKALRSLQMTCAICALFIPTSAFSEILCEKLPGAIEVLENTKEDFASGRYGPFFEIVNRVAIIDTSPETSQNNPENILQSAFPGGFHTCSTVMSQRVSERFISEIVVFMDSQDRVIFLGWDAIKVTDNWEIIKYQIEDRFDKIIAEWRS